MTIYFSKKEIDEGKSVGRKQGSKKVTHDNTFYQYKTENHHQENYTEFLLSGIPEEALSDKDVQLAPTIYLTDTPGAIASKYIETDEGFAPQTLWAAAGIEGKHPHRKEIDIDKLIEKLNGNNNNNATQYFKKDLAKCIASAALIGNHDINSGNFLIVKKDGQFRVSLIDHGKGGNKLLKGSKLFGGKIRNKKNCILDFFNSNTVTHIRPSRQTSKM